MAAKKSRRSRGDGALFYRADRDRSIGRISVNGTPRTVSARTKTEARYKLDQLRRAADDGLPVITRDRTVAELLELWRTKALPNRDLPTGASPGRTGKSLSVEQARQLLVGAAGTEFEAMWTLMRYLGLRPGEAAGLSWNNIDFHAGTIHIWRARTTNTDGSVTIGATKTPGSIRTLEAPQTVLESLEHHRQRQHAHAAALRSAWSNPDNLVFTSPSGRPADPKAVRNEFDRLIISAGIEGRWTPNLLRHTAASLMADAGLPIEQVADQLRHKDLRMLQQHYRHRIKPSIGGAHILDSVLGANPPSPDG